MFKGNLPQRVLALILLIVSSGCAGAYRDYPKGCVPYGYCPQPPLPYVEYFGCPTPIAERYLVRPSAVSAQESIDADAAADVENRLK